MKVRMEDAGPCRKILHVEVPAEDALAEYGHVLAEYLKASRVPGFRNGKAPAAIVEKHYQKAILDDARDRLVPRCYRDAIREHDVPVVAIVEVKNVALSKGTPLTFDATVDVAPDFKLPKYKKFSVKEEPVMVDEKQVEEAYQRLLDRFARFEPATDRVAGPGTLVSIDYEGKLDGKPVTEAASDCQGLGDGKDFWVLCGGEREFLPGIDAGIAGAAVGETRELAIAFPADYHVKGVAGKTAAYRVTVKDVRRKVLPEVNAELLKTLNVESVDALRARMRDDLQKGKEHAENDRRRNDVAKMLLEQTDFDLPQSVVEEETQLTVRSMVRRFANQGATREQIVERQSDIVTAATQTSKDRVKLSYVLRRIAAEEKIEIEESVVEKRLEEMAGHYEMPVAEFRAEMEKRNAIEGLRSDLRNEKTLDYLVAGAAAK